MSNTVRDVRDFFKPAPFSSEIHVDLKHFCDDLRLDRLDLSPPYQRGSVWTKKQQEDFMGHLLQGGEVQPLIVQRAPDSGAREVLDGKQRIEAVLAWLEGRVGARMDDGFLLYHEEVVGPISRISLKVRFVNLPWEDRKAFYVRLNSAGTPHTAEQLTAALEASPHDWRCSVDHEQGTVRS